MTGIWRAFYRNFLQQKQQDSLQVGSNKLTFDACMLAYLLAIIEDDGKTRHASGAPKYSSKESSEKAAFDLAVLLNVLPINTKRLVTSDTIKRHKSTAASCYRGVKPLMQARGGRGNRRAVSDRAGAGDIHRVLRSDSYPEQP